MKIIIDQSIKEFYSRGLSEIHLQDVLIPVPKSLRDYNIHGLLNPESDTEENRTLLEKHGFRIIERFVGDKITPCIQIHVIDVADSDPEQYAFNKTPICLSFGRPIVDKVINNKLKGEGGAIDDCVAIAETMLEFKLSGTSLTFGKNHSLSSQSHGTFYGYGPLGRVD